MHVNAGESNSWPHASFKPKTAVFAVRNDQGDGMNSDASDKISVLVAKTESFTMKNDPTKQMGEKGHYMQQNNMQRSSQMHNHAFHTVGNGQNSVNNHNLQMPVQNYGQFQANSTSINVPVNISVDRSKIMFSQEGQQGELKAPPFSKEQKSQQLHHFVKATIHSKDQSNVHQKGSPPASTHGTPAYNMQVPNMQQFNREFVNLDLNNQTTQGDAGQVIYNSNNLGGFNFAVNAQTLPNNFGGMMEQQTRTQSPPKTTVGNEKFDTSAFVNFSANLFNQKKQSDTASVKSFRSETVRSDISRETIRRHQMDYEATPTNMVPVIAQIPTVRSENTVENARILEGLSQTGAVGANTTGDPNATVMFLEWADGSKYYGYVLNNKRCGKGVFVWPDGILYDGHWKNNEMHGDGTLLLDGKFYIGAFANGKYNGEGIFTWHDGSIYEGGWKNGRPHGYGAYQCSRGGKYIGDWRYGTQYGSGTCLYPNGIMYTGDFKNNLRHGRGTCQWPNGSYYSGQWDNNEMRKPHELKLGISM